jgi:hypothetical protein
MEVCLHLKRIGFSMACVFVSMYVADDEIRALYLHAHAWLTLNGMHDRINRCG